MDPFILHIVFHGELAWFLSRRNREAELRLVRNRRASIKDTVEALGVPHTEVGRITLNGTSVDFNRVPTRNARFDIHPVTPPLDVTRPTLLRPEPWGDVRFLVDDNVGKLTPLLRAMGLDAAHTRGTADMDLAKLSATRQRILLTRDLGLLKRRNVLFGRCIRATQPYHQLREVLAFFGLGGPYALFSRCLLCNRPLRSIPKEAVVHRLKAETRQYVEDLYTCPSCHRLFWHGPHCKRMMNKMAEVGIDVTPC